MTSKPKEKNVKKKVLSLVIDTALTNEELEKAGAAGKIQLAVERDGPVEGETTKTTGIPVRNVRVLDSD